MARNPIIRELYPEDPTDQETPHGCIDGWVNAPTASVSETPPVFGRAAADALEAPLDVAVELGAPVNEGVGCY